VYEKLGACTIHSFYGLQTAELPSQGVIRRSLANNLVAQRIKKVDTIIWDESSMTSARVFELVNAIHHHVSPDTITPFGGKQVVIVGDFLQLRPVPNDFDEGEFIFGSRLFKVAIPHTINLTQLMRQDQDELTFLSALRDLRLGQISEDNTVFMKSLSRDFEDTAKTASAVHIFFKKIPAQLHNLAVLRELPGETQVFQPYKTGNTNGISCPVDDMLLLKPGCRVMLTWNKSGVLKNGTQGIFHDVQNDSLVVFFPNVGYTHLCKETWYKRDRNGNVVGSLSQFPLVIAYAITCHKSQGQTLHSAIVHCSQEFVPGLTYVAASRVRSYENLQLVGFSPDFLLLPSQKVLGFDITCTGWVDANKCCCSNKQLSDKLFEVNDTYTCQTHLTDDEYHLPDDHMLDNIIMSYFERDDVAIAEDLCHVYQSLKQHESDYAQPPESFNFEQVLRSLLIESPLTDNHKFKNELLNQLLSNQEMHKFKAFIALIWYHCFLFFKDHLADDPDEITVHFSRQMFTAVTGKLHSFWGSMEYVQYLKSLYKINILSVVHTVVGGEIAGGVYLAFLENIASKIRNHQTDDPIEFNVDQMSDEGQSKLRYVGAWAVKKVIQKERMYIKQNMFSLYTGTIDKVQSSHSKCTLLEDNIIVPYAAIEGNSEFPETLQVTENRQYRERGLLHISDATFSFFLRLEQLRVNTINETTLKKFKGDTVAVAQDEIMKNEQLKASWLCCFPDLSPSDTDLVSL